VKPYLKQRIKRLEEGLGVDQGRTIALVIKSPGEDTAAACRRLKINPSTNILLVMNIGPLEGRETMNETTNNKLRTLKLSIRKEVKSLHNQGYTRMDIEREIKRPLPDDVFPLTGTEKNSVSEKEDETYSPEVSRLFRKR
jgi:hypothetical protein